MKDDRKRISELKQKGFIFDEVGNCHNPDHHHTAPLKLRKLLTNPIGSGIPVKTASLNAPQQIKNDRVDQWLAQFKKEPVKETNVLF